ncbi:hypothetical protein D9M69_586850 [compost metagenome]
MNIHGIIFTGRPDFRNGAYRELVVPVPGLLGKIGSEQAFQDQGVTPLTIVVQKFVFHRYKIFNDEF